MLGLSELEWAFVALVIPLVAAFIIGVVAPLRRRGVPAAWLSVAAASLALVAAILALVTVSPDKPALYLLQWLPSGGSALAEVGIRVDGISASMLLVVTVVATSVQVFSLGYMKHEPAAAFGRYFGYHSLFIFSMNLLVLAPNLLQFFAGWELVGLTSYLLIGFYYQRPSAARAATKAFWLTKLADMGLLLGIIILFAWTRAFDWNAPLAEEQATVVTLLLFLGVMGKSAQFPLHVWLPDAMEGPTPVSALLHAATMVAAGVYLIVRANPLFSLAPDTLSVMAYIGSFTALFAAIVAVVQTDIKRVLAYSTCSQLGYMVAALGAGSLMGGFFHLTTHAFFKALLFLAAGSVIHAVHSNELTDMGGLRHRMRLTTVVFVIGALALAGVPFLAGFFSKDLILEAVAERELYLPLLFLLAAACLTAFYMGRVVVLAFFGQARSEAAEKAHEAERSMTIPLLVLALFSVVLGWFGGVFAPLYGVGYAFHIGVTGVFATLLALAGLALAWFHYEKKSIPLRFFQRLEPIAKLAQSAAIDRAYLFAYRRGMVLVSEAVGYFDRYVVDGFMNLVGFASIRSGQRLRRVQTGNVLDYVYAVVAGTIVLVAWGIFK